jgi:hypothetical protein
VDVTTGLTRVASIRSEARITTGNQVELVAAGQEVSVGDPSQARQGDTCYCYNNKGEVTGKGRINDRGVCECTEKVSGAVVGGLTTGALVTLIIVGLGGAIAGIVTAVQGDSQTGGGTFVLSNFR